VAVALVALLTGKDIIRRHMLTLSRMRYEITRYSNDELEVFREDGVQFVVDLKSGQLTLQVGTDAQMQDALVVVRKLALDQPLGGAMTVIGGLGCLGGAVDEWRKKNRVPLFTGEVRAMVNGTGQSQMIDMPAGVSARYLRVTVTAGASYTDGKGTVYPTWASLWELRVYGF
jgi:hypothetical protein